jgi:ribosomal protein S18 acetylase RimI-like enzyme
MEASHPTPDLAVRPPAAGEGTAIANLQIRSWQVAYQGIFPDSYLDSLDGALEQRGERWEGYIARDVPLGRLLVATIAGEVVAFSSYGPAGATHDHADGAPPPPPRLGEIYGFYTHPDHWRRGAGRALMERTVEALVAASFEKAILWVLKDNPRARTFYEVTGWQPTGEESIFRRDEIAAAEVCYSRRL